MISIGLTGGIGSGKTTVAKVWESMGAFVLIADDLAKKLMAESPVIKRQIEKEFGKEAYHKDGTLNREYLSKEAFEKNRIEILNSIVHPQVFDEADKIRIKAQREGYHAFVYEAALLLKYGRPASIDFVVVVDAPDDKRVERVAKRDHSNPSDVTGRMNKQADPKSLKRQADYVIENSGTLQELETKARELYSELVKR